MSYHLASVKKTDITQSWEKEEFCIALNLKMSIHLFFSFSCSFPQPQPFMKYLVLKFLDETDTCQNMKWKVALAQREVTTHIGWRGHLYRRASDSRHLLGIKAQMGMRKASAWRKVIYLFLSKSFILHLFLYLSTYIYIKINKYEQACIT